MKTLTLALFAIFLITFSLVPILIEAQIYAPPCSIYHFHDRDDLIWREGIRNAQESDKGFFPCNPGTIRDNKNNLIVKDECITETTLYEYSYEDNKIIQHSVHCNRGCIIGSNDIGFCRPSIWRR